MSSVDNYTSAALTVDALVTTRQEAEVVLGEAVRELEADLTAIFGPSPRREFFGGTPCSEI